MTFILDLHPTLGPIVHDRSPFTLRQFELK